MGGKAFSIFRCHDLGNWWSRKYPLSKGLCCQSGIGFYNWDQPDKLRKGFCTWQNHHISQLTVGKFANIITKIFWTVCTETSEASKPNLEFWVGLLSDLTPWQWNCMPNAASMVEFGTITVITTVTILRKRTIKSQMGPHPVGKHCTFTSLSTMLGCRKVTTSNMWKKMHLNVFCKKCEILPHIHLRTVGLYSQTLVRLFCIPHLTAVTACEMVCYIFNHINGKWFLNPRYYEYICTGMWKAGWKQLLVLICFCLFCHPSLLIGINIRKLEKTI
jgi:hypothetical protein